MSFENEPDDPTQSLELFGDGGGDASQPALPWQGQNQQDFKCHLMRRNLCHFFFCAASLPPKVFVGFA